MVNETHRRAALLRTKSEGDPRHNKKVHGAGLLLLLLMKEKAPLIRADGLLQISSSQNCLNLNSI